MTMQGLCTSVYVWKALADKGVWQLYARIGEVYERGGAWSCEGYRSGFDVVRKALFEGDDPIAHLGMGRAYFNGIGCARDFNSALQHFTKAHALEMHEATLFLRVMHYRGAAVERNSDIASNYLLAAANAGYPAAYSYLVRLAWDRLRPIRALSCLIKGILLGTRLARADSNTLG
jgi:TPR repeat protein